MLLFPTSFYFASIYSESLFLLLVVSSFYLARKRSWFYSSLLAMLAASTRLVGIVMLPALAVEYYLQKKSSSAIWWIGLIPAGLIAYMRFNLLKWGDALYFVKVHATLGNSRSIDSIVLFPQTMFRYLKILTTIPAQQYGWWIAGLELLIFVAVTYLLYYAWRQKVRLSYLFFAITSFLIPASSGTFSGLPRYVLALFPIYIGLALMGKKQRYLALTIGSTLLFVLLSFFSRGYYIS